MDLKEEYIKLKDDENSIFSLLNNVYLRIDEELKKEAKNYSKIYKIGVLNYSMSDEFISGGFIYKNNYYFMRIIKINEHLHYFIDDVETTDINQLPLVYLISKSLNII